METNSVTSQPSTQIPPSPQSIAPPPSPSPAVLPRKPRSNWLLIAVLVVIAFLLGIGVEKFRILSFIKALPLPRIMIVMPAPTSTSTPSPTPNLQPSSSPAATSSATLYTCPPNGYVDCMPILDEAKKKACSPEAMSWYKTNCPDFKGGAL